jgi:transposase
MDIGRIVDQPRGRSEGKPHADLLDLEGVRSKPDKGNGAKWVIKVLAEQVEIPTYPNCDCPIKEVKLHSTFKMPKIYDAPRGGKHFIFSLRRRRWQCKSCGKTTTQPVDFLAEGRYHMTQRLLEYLQVHSLFETEHSLYKETGVFVRTIREIREE